VAPESSVRILRFDQPTRSQKMLSAHADMSEHERALAAELEAAVNTFRSSNGLGHEPFESLLKAVKSLGWIRDPRRSPEKINTFGDSGTQVDPHVLELRLECFRLRRKQGSATSSAPQAPMSPAILLQAITNLGYTKNHDDDSSNSCF
jgi:hypothetical protein